MLFITRHGGVESEEAAKRQHYGNQMVLNDTSISSHQFCRGAVGAVTMET